MPDLVDLSKLAGLTVRQETDQELQARLEREQLELRHKLHTQLVTFYAMGSLYLAAFAGSFYVSVTSGDAEVRKWAMSLVTLLAGALGGYFTGKQSK